MEDKCLVCGEPVEIYTVYTVQKKFKKVKGVCIPCKEKQDERFKPKTDDNWFKLKK